jgi:hypothetical protein
MIVHMISNSWCVCQSVRSRVVIPGQSAMQCKYLVFKSCFICSCKLPTLLLAVNV